MGYHCSSYTVSTSAIAMDKALRYFCTEQNGAMYDHVWFLEDDVLVPTNSTLAGLDAKYGGEADILSRQYGIVTHMRTDWHWPQAILNGVPLPWANSMVCAIRLSRAMLGAVREHVESRGRLFFIEIMFLTLAIHRSLRIQAIPEMRGLIYQYQWNSAGIQPGHLYHPVKKIEDQIALRDQVRALLSGEIQHLPPIVDPNGEFPSYQCTVEPDLI